MLCAAADSTSLSNFMCLNLSISEISRSTLILRAEPRQAVTAGSAVAMDTQRFEKCSRLHEIVTKSTISSYPEPKVFRYIVQYVQYVNGSQSAIDRARKVQDEPVARNASFVAATIDDCRRQRGSSVQNRAAILRASCDSRESRAPRSNSAPTFGAAIPASFRPWARTAIRGASWMRACAHSPRHSIGSDHLLGTRV